MTPPEALLVEMDEQWGGQESPKLRFRILGSLALMLQTDYERGTKDSDLLFTDPVDGPVRERLLRLGGPESVLARRHRVYLDVVSSGLLMLPGQPVYNPLPVLNAKLTHFEAEALSVPDVVITKLKPFRPADIADIEAMIQRGHVSHEQFVNRFRSAIDRFADGATGAAKLPRIVENFHQIERDAFGVDETGIELPPWVDED